MSGGLPPGVDPSGDPAMHAGVYAATPHDEVNCCWMAGHATFRTAVPADAKGLRFTVFLPSSGPYEKRAESVQISVDGAPPRTFAGLRSGIRVLAVPLAPFAKERQAVVDIVAGYEWVPTNGDTRKLSLQLKSVRAQ